MKEIYFCCMAASIANIVAYLFQWIFHLNNWTAMAISVIIYFPICERLLIDYMGWNITMEIKNRLQKRKIEKKQMKKGSL